MAHPSWGPGWPNCQSNRIKTLTRADGLKLPVREELVTLVGLLIDGTERLGYDVKPKTTFGFACRQIFTKKGLPTGKPSNHSWGLAVDINSTDNPFGAPLRTNLPRPVIDLWKRHGFNWGGDFKTEPDPMHFEYLHAKSEVAGHTQQALASLGPFLVEEEDMQHFVSFDGHPHVFVVYADHMAHVPNEAHLHFLLGNRRVEKKTMQDGLVHLPVRTRRQDGTVVDIPLAQFFGG